MLLAIFWRHLEKLEWSNIGNLVPLPQNLVPRIIQLAAQTGTKERRELGSLKLNLVS